MRHKVTLAALLALATAAQAAPEPLKLPIVTKPLKLSYWVPISPNAAAVVKSYDDIGAYKEVQKRTGIELTFTHVPYTGNTPAQALSLMAASGELNDIIEYNWNFYPGGPEKALKDGLIIRLNDYVDQYAPNLKALLDKNPKIRKEITTADGDIFAFPFLRVDPSLRVFSGPVIRQDWLTKVRLPAPTTIDGWYRTLRAFKTRDPNGNGKADELPWVWNGQSFANGSDALLGAFGGAFALQGGFFLKDGKVTHHALEPEYKNFLATMRKWYAEGLIDPDYVVANQNQFDAKMLNNLAGSTLGFAGGTLTRLNDLAKTPGFKLVGAAYPSGKDRVGYNSNPDANKIFPGTGAAISSKNRNIKETVKLLDYAYSKDGSMLFNFGILGQSYVMQNGQPVFTADVRNNDKLPFSQSLARYARGSFDGPFVQDPRVPVRSPEALAANKTWRRASTALLLPPISPAAEDASRFASIMNDVQTYLAEMSTRYITGRESLDAYDRFQATLKNQGLLDARAIMQKALDRYNAKK